MTCTQRLPQQGANTYSFRFVQTHKTARWGVADILLALRWRLGLPLASPRSLGWGLYE